MIGSHFDDVVEVKASDLKMNRHKPKGIPKLCFRVIGQRSIRAHTRYSGKKHELSRIQNWRKMPQIWNVREFARYKHFAHDSFRQNMVWRHRIAATDVATHPVVW